MCEVNVAVACLAAIMAFVLTVIIIVTFNLTLCLIARCARNANEEVRCYLDDAYIY